VNGPASLIKLAWRSLQRQRRRTVLLIAVVAYATFTILFFWGFVDGFLVSILQGQAKLVYAPVTVTTPAYHDDPDPVHALPDLDAALAAVQGAPRVDASAPRVELAALLRSPYASRGVLLRGVDPQREPRVSDVPSRIGEGRMIEAPGEAVLGTILAGDLDVRVGERIAIDAASLAGPAATGVTLVGIVDAGIELVDETTAWVHLDDARTLAGVDGATSVAVAVPPGREASVAQDLNERLPDGVAAYGIMDQMGELARGLAAERLSMIPIGLIFSVFAAIAVTSSVLVSVMERTREFGVMLSLGLAPGRLAWMVTLEAVLASLLGYAVGALAGYALLIWLANVNLLGPLFLGLWSDMFSTLAIENDIRTDVRAMYLIPAGLTVALAALFAALTPARRVRSLVPAEAMRSAD
jgi:ABC-type lipoprotein release transport system permease subunit